MSGRLPDIPTGSVEKDAAMIQELLHNSDDLQINDFWLNNEQMKILFFDTLTDSQSIHEQILQPILHHPEATIAECLPAATIKVVQTLDDAVSCLLKGFVALLFSERQDILCISAKSSFIRTTVEPRNEKVVRGAHDGFIENLNVNVHLVRNMIENRQLTVTYYTVGKETQTRVALLYMNDLANRQVVQEMEKRIQSIHADSILGTNFIEEYVEDSPFSPFPQLLSTERPDRVTANLMEGRVALLASGAPTALIFPVTFFAFYQSPDDYNSRWFAGTFFRIIRLISFFIAISLPAIYIATVAFRFEILPSNMIIAIKQSIDKVPYPPLVEAFIMEITIELIREAGIRLPSPLGQTIGVIGGIVIGQAVVQANLVSNIMVIVVAITAIAAYVVPSNEMGTAVRLLRFGFMISAATIGLLGIVLSFTLLLIHLCALESFGTPYLAPLSTVKWRNLKDTFVRFPMWKMSNRPVDAAPQKSTQETISRGWQPDDPRE
ncbi:spore gernimation protein GerK [Brevibacillus choshinensis]|uniref:Spore gernimation protein GerK n=1 Tax=Brevibacillus choshinensis TaxID=54911 RepID=A0ABR5N3B3_BRECH|nr:spore germination protein [Brevibacillus choshinensis]KQL44990.1 spore gernimation protein GerK [Brevibacillus choshinensis]